MRLPAGTLKVETTATSNESTKKQKSSPVAQLVDHASEGPAYRLRIGDAIAVYLRGIPREQSLEMVIDEHGSISLPFLEPLKAAGLTSSDLEQVIHDAYVPNYYKQITVNILVPSQSYYVKGAVRSPGRFPIIRGGMTLLQAIATAGGFTDYANPKNVRILRGGDSEEYSVKEIEKDPDKDVPVIAGDLIVVRRRLL